MYSPLITYINRKLLILQGFVCEPCLIDKINHIYSINHTFCNLEGGKILKTKKAGEAISGHFVRTILPSVNEQFQRILLPFIVCSFLNINLDRYASCLY